MTRTVAIAAALLLAGCAGGDRFALLPDEDGKVGSIVVQNRSGSQTLSQAATLTRVRKPDAAPTVPVPLAQDDLQATWGEARAATPRAPVSILLYFETGGSVLTPDSAALIPTLQPLIAQYPAPEVTVIGHTDTVGTAADNARLAQSRAQTVRALLTAAGIDPAIILVTSHGEANPLVRTPDKMDEPRNRRVEVTVR